MQVVRVVDLEFFHVGIPLGNKVSSPVQSLVVTTRRWCSNVSMRLEQRVLRKEMQVLMDQGMVLVEMESGGEVVVEFFIWLSIEEKK